MGDSIPLGRSYLAKYPFLPRAKQIMSELDIDLADLGSLKEIVERARQRLAASLIFDLRADKPNKKIDIEIASFPVATLIVGGVNDASLTKRYALFESKKMYNQLIVEKDEVVLEIAQFFKWKKVTKFEATRGELTVLNYRMHFVDYLNNISSLVYDPRWKIVNRQLHEGHVEVTLREVCRLLQEEIREYIENRVAGKLPQIPRIIQDTVDEIKGEYHKMKPHVTEFDKMRVFAERSEYPPCIQNLYDRAVRGQHLSHLERFTLVTYLLHQDISIDTIVTLFAGLSDFRQAQTRYQVEHLAGQRGSKTEYRPPNCTTLRTHGVCIELEDPTCRTIKSPLTYHLRKKPPNKRG